MHKNTAKFTIITMKAARNNAQQTLHEHRPKCSPLCLLLDESKANAANTSKSDFCTFTKLLTVPRSLLLTGCNRYYREYLVNFISLQKIFRRKCSPFCLLLVESKANASKTSKSDFWTFTMLLTVPNSLPWTAWKI